jgi:hypothetical protein
MKDVGGDLSVLTMRDSSRDSFESADCVDHASLWTSGKACTEESRL